MPLVSRTFDQLFNFTRTSAATFVGSNGLVQTTPASVNLLTFTQEFDNAAWIKNAGATVAANVAVAPDGTNTADRISFTNDELSRVQQAITSPLLAHAYSIWLRSESGTVTVRFGESGSLTAVTVTETWQRFTVVVTTANPNVTIRNEVAAGIKSVLAWGAQVEVGSVATTYTRNFGGVFPPRLDYNPATLLPRGLLVEQQVTNLFTYSADFTNAVWAKTNITATAAAAVSPDGTTNAQKIEATATAVTTFTSSATAVAATNATFSIYVKQGTGATTANAFLLRNSTTATNLIAGTLDYSTGVWTYSTGSTGVTVTNAGNGWWRVQIAATSGITSGNNLIGYIGFTGGAQTAGNHLFAWGAQLEALPFASSYIPTVASQVTRTSDQTTISAPNFASWYNQPEGTLFVEFSVLGINTVSETLAMLSDNTANNILLPFVNSGGTSFVNVISGGVTSANLSTGAVTVGAVSKHASAYLANGFAATLNGAAPAIDSAGAVPVGVNTLNIGWSAPYGGLFLNGHIRSVRYYPTRLNDAQLQALTA